MQLNNFLLPLTVMVISSNPAAGLALRESFTLATTSVRSLGNTIGVASSGGDILESGRKVILAFDGATAAVQEASPLGPVDAISVVTAFVGTTIATSETARIATSRRDEMEDLGIAEEVLEVFTDIFIGFDDLAEESLNAVPTAVRPRIQSAVDSLRAVASGVRAAYE